MIRVVNKGCIIYFGSNNFVYPTPPNNHNMMEEAHLMKKLKFAYAVILMKLIKIIV